MGEGKKDRQETKEQKEKSKRKRAEGPGCPGASGAKERRKVGSRILAGRGAHSSVRRTLAHHGQGSRGLSPHPLGGGGKARETPKGRRATAPSVPTSHSHLPDRGTSEPRPHLSRLPPCWPPSSPTWREQGTPRRISLPGTEGGHTPLTQPSPGPHRRPRPTRDPGRKPAQRKGRCPDDPPSGVKARALGWTPRESWAAGRVRGYRAEWLGNPRPAWSRCFPRRGSLAARRG